MRNAAWLFWIAWTTTVALASLWLVLYLWAWVAGWPMQFHVDGRA